VHRILADGGVQDRRVVGGALVGPPRAVHGGHLGRPVRFLSPGGLKTEQAARAGEARKGRRPPKFSI
jgi:hypothetical protein